MTKQDLKQLILEFRTSYMKDPEELKELLKLAQDFNDANINEELGELFDLYMWNLMRDQEEYG